MCECCDEVIKRSVKRSAKQPSVTGEPIDIRILALPLEPKATDRGKAVAAEKARPALEEAATA